MNPFAWIWQKIKEGFQFVIDSVSSFFGFILDAIFFVVDAIWGALNQIWVAFEQSSLFQDYLLPFLIWHHSIFSDYILPVLLVLGGFVFTIYFGFFALIRFIADLVSIWQGINPENGNAFDCGCLKDIFYEFVGLSFELSIAIVNSLGGVMNTFDPTQYGGLPPEIAAAFQMVGLGKCLSIIIQALLIRFVLQAIPFVRWGS